MNHVCKKLCELKVNKACGYDNINAKFIKCGANVLSQSITSAINVCISESVFPSVCKHAEISPVHKKKDHLVISNYRPVSILTCVNN